MNRDYNEAMDALRFSPEAKERMAANLTAARPEVRATRSGKRRWRFAAVVAAAAVLAVGVGGGAYATGALMSMGNVFDDLFGGPPAQTEVVDKIGRPLGASATSAGVTITAEAIVGDRANYVIVFSVAKDDGTPFEGVKVLETGALSLGFGPEGAQEVNIDGVMTGGGSTGFYDADPADNAVQYVEKASVTALGDTIIGRTARVKFADLCVYDDNGWHTIADGTWSMKFTVDYEDTSIDLPAGQRFDLNGMEATLDSISISPLALTLEYTAHEAVNREDSPSGLMSEQSIAQENRFLAPTLMLAMKDGTTMEIDATKAAGGWTEQDNSTACHKNIMFDEFLNLDDIASITIGGTEIPLP